MKTTLVIMAAGMGSRYGGLKQIDSFGPNGETILEYSIYDAIRAGFTDVVIVIRKSFEEQFKEVLGSRFDDKINVNYAFQEINPMIEGFDSLPERTKPRGTGHAVLAAKDFVEGPFCVINADDYYGVDGYRQMHDWLLNNCKEKEACIIGYYLENTLSDTGTVNRGICKVSDAMKLEYLRDHHAIARNAEGKIVDDEKNEFQNNTVVSMTMLGFHESFLPYLENNFHSFLSEEENHKKEFYITTHGIDAYIKEEGNSCEVKISKDKRYGVTYADDKITTQNAIKALLDDGVYPENLRE